MRNRPGSKIVAARVSGEIFETIDAAARMRGKSRGWVVEEGALRFAREILATAAQSLKEHRRKIRIAAAAKRKGNT